MSARREDAVRRLVVALDTSDRAAILALARDLSGRVGMFKVGLEAFTAHGPALVGEVRALGVPVFLDLKLHDIPNTVERAARNLARLGVAVMTTHAGGGRAMLEAAARGAAAGTPEGAARPLVLAVTVLTSLDDAALDELGIPGGAAARVASWAELARAAGCDGVVCSPRETAALRARLGPEFVLLTPGIRPAGGDVGDQKRVATPRDAVAAGATYIVVGRPITAAPDPAAAAEAILAELLD
ncbi:MAG: orotidine-5'-phosphate decarboxylase [Acidobacteriota bacterium]